MKITDTEAIIARVRAEEGDLPGSERLFVDPFAHLFAGPPADREVAEQFAAVPFLREQVRLRTRFIDDFVRGGVADGIRQLVILGAGFDCRALRLDEIASTGSRVYEVDFAEQLATKRSVLEAGGVSIPDLLRFIPCDFTTADFESSLLDGLVREGLVTGARTLFTWEGVISYLAPTEVDRMLRWIAAAGAPGSRLVFNYPVNQFIGNDPDGMSTRVKAAGFSSIDDRSLGALHRQYFGADAASDIAELFRIAIAFR